MTIIALPNILTERLTEQGTKALVEILDKVEERSQQATLEIAEERFEKRIAQLGAKIDGARVELNANIENVHAELDAKIENFRAELDAKIENVRAELSAKIESVRAELEAKIDSVQANTDVKIEGLRVEMQKMRANIIMWMFIFWVGQVSTITAILFAFFKSG
jgi:multidrug efflux pump subunit AcrA (membrane-fusion protein)